MSETSSFEEADWTWLHAAPAGFNKLLFYPSCLLKIEEEQPSSASMDLACVTHNMIIITLLIEQFQKQHLQWAQAEAGNSERQYNRINAEQSRRTEGSTD